MLRKFNLNFLLKIAVIVLCSFSNSAFAAISDPETKGANMIKDILFGPFGTSLCVIAVGGSFASAMAGKMEFSRFFLIVLIVAGYLGSPTIVTMIKTAVSS